MRLELSVLKSVSPFEQNISAIALVLEVGTMTGFFVSETPL